MKEIIPLNSSSPESSEEPKKEGAVRRAIRRVRKSYSEHQRSLVPPSQRAEASETEIPEAEPAEPQAGTGEPRETQPETGRFEGEEYSEEKRKRDPLSVFAIERLGIRPEEADFSYAVREFDAEYKIARVSEFSNYHDALRYFRDLPEEERKKASLSGYLRGRADEELFKLEKDSSPKSQETVNAFYGIRETLDEGLYADAYAEAVARGEVKEIQGSGPKTREAPRSVLGEQLRSFFRKEGRKPRSEGDPEPAKESKEEKTALPEKQSVLSAEELEELGKDPEIEASRKIYADALDKCRGGKFRKAEKVLKEKVPDLLLQLTGTEEAETEPAKKKLAEYLLTLGFSPSETEAFFLKKKAQSDYAAVRDEAGGRIYRQKYSEIIREMMEEHGSTETWGDDAKQEFEESKAILKADLYHALIVGESRRLREMEKKGWGSKALELGGKMLQPWLRLDTKTRMAVSVLFWTGTYAVLSEAGLALVAGYATKRALGYLLGAASSVGVGKGFDILYKKIGIAERAQAKLDKQLAGGMEEIMEKDEAYRKIADKIRTDENIFKAARIAAMLAAGMGTATAFSEAWGMTAGGAEQTAAHAQPTGSRHIPQGRGSATSGGIEPGTRGGARVEPAGPRSGGPGPNPEPGTSARSGIPEQGARTAPPASQPGTPPSPAENAPALNQAHPRTGTEPPQAGKEAGEAAKIIAEKAPDAAETERIAQLAEIKKGEGFWHAIHRQVEDRLQHHPDKFGLKPEDINDPAQAEHIKHLADQETAKILSESNLQTDHGAVKMVNPDGTELRIREVGSRVVLDQDGHTVHLENGHTYVHQPEPAGTHAPAEPVSAEPAPVGPEAGPAELGVPAQILEPNLPPETYAEQAGPGQAGQVHEVSNVEIWRPKDSIISALDRQLETHSGGRFAALSAVDRGEVLNYLRFQMDARPDIFKPAGLGTSIMHHPGDAVDFSPLFKDPRLIQDALEYAGQRRFLVNDLHIPTAEYIHPNYALGVRGMDVSDFLKHYGHDALGGKAPLGRQEVFYGNRMHGVQVGEEFGGLAEFIEEQAKNDPSLLRLKMSEFLKMFGQVKV